MNVTIRDAEPPSAPAGLSSRARRTRVGAALFAALLAVVTFLGGAGCASRESTIAQDFTLPAAGGGQASLSALLQEHPQVVLVFYRGLF
jgi:hypothetical protein